MSNLCYFLHYHRGDKQEKTIKIGGSFLILLALALFGAATQTSVAAEQQASLNSQMMPEPGYLMVQEPTAVAPAPATTAAETRSTAPAPTSAEGSQPVPPVNQPQPTQIQTCNINGKEMPGPCDKYQTNNGPSNNNEGDNGDKMDQFNEERQKQELTRWKADRLRDAKNFLRELEKVRKQFVRLKGSADEVTKLVALKTPVTEFVAKVNAATDNDDLRDILEEADFSESWDALNNLRSAVEIPKQLNNLVRDQKRVSTMLKQKWVCKQIDCAQFMAVIQNMNTALNEATALYKAGEYEDARETIREAFDERGWYGDAMGAVQMMRGFLEPLKQIRDKDLKAEMEEMINEVKTLLYAGDVREARETMEVLQKELGPSIFRLIMNAQKKKQAIPDAVLNKMEQLRQKFEQQPAATEETQTAPTQLAPPQTTEPSTPIQPAP